MINTSKLDSQNTSTPEILNFLNASLGPGDFEIHPLAGDASARRYFRIVAEGDSWVLMLWEPFIDDGSYPFLSVRSHFEKHGVQVPKVIGLRPEQGLVLLEDLGDLTLERKFWENQNEEHSLPYYFSTIDELLKMHYQSTFDRSSPCVAFNIEFDSAKLLWEMNYGREHLLEGLCNIKIGAPAQKELQNIFLDVCDTLSAEPKFIAHRDYHSRNVMIKHGKVRVIDFQDARMGTIQYDLVSLLRDSYVNLSDESILKLLNYYLEGRSRLQSKFQLPTVSRDHFDHIFEVQTIQRCFKACGSFASFKMLREDNRYLKYLTPTLKTVRRSLEPFSKYRPFLSLLEDNGVFETAFEAS